MHTRAPNTIREILLPFTKELPVTPSVMINDPITTAIEVMIENNVKTIAVVCNHRPVGRIRLKDAFASMGIQFP